MTPGDVSESGRRHVGSSAQSSVRERSLRWPCPRARDVPAAEGPEGLGLGAGRDDASVVDEENAPVRQATAGLYLFPALGALEAK